MHGRLVLRNLPYQPGRHLPFAERAALVLGNWAYSGAQRLWGRGLEHRWFTGLVLLDCTLRQAGPGRPAGWAW